MQSFREFIEQDEKLLNEDIITALVGLLGIGVFSTLIVGIVVRHALLPAMRWTAKKSLSLTGQGLRWGAGFLWRKLREFLFGRQFTQNEMAEIKVLADKGRKFLDLIPPKYQSIFEQISSCAVDLAQEKTRAKRLGIKKFELCIKNIEGQLNDMSQEDREMFVSAMQQSGLAN